MSGKSGKPISKAEGKYWKLSFFRTSGEYDSCGNMCVCFKTTSEFIFHLFLIKMISGISEGLMEAYVLIKCHTAIAS